jgi:hypothetical protein
MDQEQYNMRQQQQSLEPVPVNVQIPPLMLQLQHHNSKTISPPPSSSPSPSTPMTRKKKRSLSNIERFHSLKESFNQLYKEIVQSYLVDTIHYESKENMERLEKFLYEKFIHQSRPTVLKSEIQYIRSFLQSMKSIFECFYEKYMAESSFFLLRHPALLKKRVDVFIHEYVDMKKYKKINKKTRKQICETISSVAVGGQRDRRRRK